MGLLIDSKNSFPQNSIASLYIDTLYNKIKVFDQVYCDIWTGQDSYYDNFFTNNRLDQYFAIFMRALQLVSSLKKHVQKPISSAETPVAWERSNIHLDWLLAWYALSTSPQQPLTKDI